MLWFICISHPSINPCDLLPRPRPHYEFGESGVIPLYWKMAPRYPMGYRDPRMDKKSDASEVIEKYSSYYLLEGNLFRWKELYNQLPPKDSWVWLWYPDGRKEKMAAFANSTVEVWGSLLFSLFLRIGRRRSCPKKLPHHSDFPQIA